MKNGINWQLIVGIIGVLGMIYFGVRDQQKGVIIRDINQDISYIQNNNYYQTAPSDIKQKIESIQAVSGNTVMLR